MGSVDDTEDIWQCLRCGSGFYQPQPQGHWFHSKVSGFRECTGHVVKVSHALSREERERVTITKDVLCEKSD